MENPQPSLTVAPAPPAPVPCGQKEVGQPGLYSTVPPANHSSPPAIKPLLLKELSALTSKLSSKPAEGDLVGCGRTHPVPRHCSLPNTETQLSRGGIKPSANRRAERPGRAEQRSSERRKSQADLREELSSISNKGGNTR